MFVKEINCTRRGSPEKHPSAYKIITPKPASHPLRKYSCPTSQIISSKTTKPSPFLSLKGVQPGQLSDQLDILQEQLSLGPPVTAGRGRRSLPVLPRWDGLFQTMLKEAETMEVLHLLGAGALTPTVPLL